MLPHCGVCLLLASTMTTCAETDLKAWADLEDAATWMGWDVPDALQLLQLGFSARGNLQGLADRARVPMPLSMLSASPGNAIRSGGEIVGDVPYIADNGLGDYIEENVSPRLSVAIAGLVCVTGAFVFSIALVTRWAYGKDDIGLTRCSSALQKLAIALLVASCICILILLVQYYAGAVLQRLIEQYSVAFLGVSVRLRRLQVNPFIGAVLASGLEISNPTGYRTDHLATADSLYFDIDMAPLVFSLAHHIVIDSVMVRGVHVNYERGLSSSNIDVIIDRLGLGQGEGTRKVSLHAVDIMDVKAKAAVSVVGTPGLTLSVGDVKYTDFEGETGKSYSDDIVKVILATVLKSAGAAFQ